MIRLVARLTVLSVAVAGLALLRGPADAEEKGGLPIDLAHVPGKAGAIITVRPTDLWGHELMKAIRGKAPKDVEAVAESIEKELGLPPAAIERVTHAFPTIGQGANTSMMFVAANTAVDRKKLLAKLVPGGEEKTHAGKKYVANEHRGVVIFDDKHFVVAPVGEIQSMLDAGPAKADSPIMPGLKLASAKHAIVVAVNPEQLEKLSDELPADAEPFKPLLRAKLGTLALDLGESAKATVRVTFPNTDDAKAGQKALTIARKMGLGLLEQGAKHLATLPDGEVLAKLAKQAGKGLEAAKLTQDGASALASAELNLDTTAATVLAESMVKVRVAAARMQTANNLKQIGLAMHGYHDANNSFPPQAIYNKDGKALLSWRVLILPYIEQDALYREFKLDEAWDSPHNKKLLAKMPAVYKIPNAKPQNQYGTFFQVFYGKGAAFEGKAGQAIASFTDGTSNTILLAESAADVPWTKPTDIEFDAGKDVPKLGGHFPGGFNALFADGSVRFISDAVDKDKLKALITRNGGEVINCN